LKNTSQVKLTLLKNYFTNLSNISPKAKFHHNVKLFCDEYLKNSSNKILGPSGIKAHQEIYGYRKI